MIQYYKTEQCPLQPVDRIPSFTSFTIQYWELFLWMLLRESKKRKCSFLFFLDKKVFINLTCLCHHCMWKLYISGGDKCRLWALRLITLNCSMPNCSIHSFMYDMGWCYPVFKRHDHFVQITTLWHHFANQSKIWSLGVTIQWWSPTWQNDQKYQTLASWKSSKLHLQYSIPHQLIWNIFKI